MFLAEAAFGLCVLFLVCACAAQIVASRNGDKRGVHGLHLVKIGLSLSACAYLFHLLGPSPGSPYSILSLLSRLAGITFLWLAWKDHWKRQYEFLNARTSAEGQEQDDAPALRTPLPPEYAALYSGLNTRAREVLCAAQEEAVRRHQCCVDTDHLLLGLLRVPQSTASRLLEHSHILAEPLTRELDRRANLPEHSINAEDFTPAAPALTHRARQVLEMAEMEAHRFDKTFVGTEHLLLGLLLVGTGPAASTLFEAGMTVDGLRREVIAAGKRQQ